MNFSLNEVEALAKRATRGAGYPWGLAEEAGKATRWLCALGLDGTGELAKLLELDLAGALNAHAVRTLRAPWQASHSLCPLMAGAALSDHAGVLARDALRMLQVARPLLIVPFAAAAARQAGAPVAVSSGDWGAVTDGTELTLSGPTPEHARELRVDCGSRLALPASHESRAVPDPTQWATLNRFAQRTYAPATEESRRLGAGSAASDND